MCLLRKPTLLTIHKDEKNTNAEKNTEEKRIKETKNDRDTFNVTNYINYNEEDHNTLNIEETRIKQ